MKVFSFLLIGLAVMLTFTLLAAAQNVQTDYDHHVAFDQFHTYSWGQIKTEDSLWEPRVRNAVDKALQSKGWQMVESGGQVTVSAVGAVKNTQYYQTFYNGMGGWGWGGFGTTATTSVQNERVGTLVVDVYDSNDKKLIWRGVATDTLAGSPEKNQKKLQKAADKMFKKFPPKQGKT
jgi:hypothetical protein